MSERRKKRQPTMALDPFSVKRFPGIAKKWLDAKRQRQERMDDLWAGMLARMFSDDELTVMWEMGFLSEYDERVMRRVSLILHPNEVPPVTPAAEEKK